MRQPCCVKDTSRQSLQIVFLLANRRIRRRRSHQKIPGLPILQQEDPRPSTQLDYNPSIMAVRLLKSGHDRTSHRSSRRIQSCAGGSRQVYQVDRVQANCQDLIRGQWISSPTSHINLVSLTLSLQIWVLTLPHSLFGISMRILA